VIIGGSLLNSYTFQEIRDIVFLIAEKKYMKNLMIVKGYVDLTTDLYKMVREWKDVEITENDFYNLLGMHRGLYGREGSQIKKDGL
jgi:hypothetical protein